MDRRNENPAEVPDAWATMAYTLVFAANTLYQKYESWRENVLDKSHAQSPSGGLYYEVSFNIVLMLYGLAIENLVKGLLIAKGVKPFVTSPKELAKIKGLSEVETAIGIMTGAIKRILNKDLDRHDLNVLFNKAGVLRNSEDEELLTFLQDAIESGRYPIAKDAKRRDVAFPYLRRYSPKAIRQHIMVVLNNVDSQLRAEGWGNKTIDLESAGMDSREPIGG